MTRDDIITGCHALLDDHIVWRRGHWDHKSCKLAFFKLFRSAYEEGFFRIRGRYAVTGERLREDIMERYITVSNAKNIANRTAGEDGGRVGRVALCVGHGHIAQDDFDRVLEEYAGDEALWFLIAGLELCYN